MFSAFMNAVAAVFELFATLFSYAAEGADALADHFDENAVCTCGDDDVEYVMLDDDDEDDDDEVDVEYVTFVYDPETGTITQSHTDGVVFNGYLHMESMEEGE